MGTVRTLNAEKKQKILQLYFCSNDKRLKVIANLTQSSDGSVSKVLQEFFDGKIKFETDYYIYQSKINEYDARTIPISKKCS